jgi:hypothetical protein
VELVDEYFNYRAPDLHGRFMHFKL